MKKLWCLFSLGLFFSPFGYTHNFLPDYDDQQVFIGEGIAEADTEYGKIRGFQCRGIYTFLGIPYGADTSGKNRFMPPSPPLKWDGIRPTVAFGASCPQSFYDRAPESYSMFVDHWNYDLMNEDCLRLNIWTPQNNSSKKRPVLVWLHGGGFTNGNAIEQDGYNGENIARYGDIVFCSVNHRLGPLGFCDLSAADSCKYLQSANVGMLDIVMALKWVKKNISNFGGDPDNVTIMGQSGGGSKVCMLCAMPTAKGLFHKAVALSGNAVCANNCEYSKSLGLKIIAEAGLNCENVDSLQLIPTDKLLEYSERAKKSMSGQLSGYRDGFAPVANDIDIPSGTFFSDKNTGAASDVPVLLCSTFHEWNPDRDDPEFENLSFTDIYDKLYWRYGEKTQQIIDAYHNTFPNLPPIEIWSLIASNRTNIIKTADAFINQKSPVYLAWFGWKSPLFNGRHRSFHCLDISFWFLNTDLMLTHTGGGIKPRLLSNKMANALLSFMRTGNPNCDSLPQWPIYSSEHGEVMILNDECVVANDPDRQPRQLLTK